MNQRPKGSGHDDSGQERRVALHVPRNDDDESSRTCEGSSPEKWIELSGRYVDCCALIKDWGDFVGLGFVVRTY
jgi:hypothetical protein